MAMTNHAMVRLAGLRCGFIKFDNYIILGDDIVIYDDDVSKEYIKLMNSVGVEITLADSIFSKQTHPCEIAKRLFRNGIEVSPIPLGLYRTNKGLFEKFLWERSFRIDILHSDPVTSLRSQVSARLLLLYTNRND